ncbi:hypothetical protein DFP72DRAFT_799240 [Ephemerocybe angulata]|uniref:Kinetochore protein Spc24 n=1 Tax=Ephemerocybe angulata TaxID=980116 RepID=A0A8H6II86_9AGAR|nr:hypothetical protein DFP72DRAFT_799240 [Tulosesus angulatus]
MSIDVQEAIQVIRDLHPVIDPDEDYLTIVAAEEKIVASESKRKKELEEAHSKLKALSRIYEAARVSSTRHASIPSQADHASLLNELDNSKLSLAKAISDAEGLVGSKEAELAALKEEARQLEAYDPAVEHAKELDGSVLRLQLIKGLGFEPINDPNKHVAKMLVRATSGDIHTVDLSTGISEFDNTQQLWKLANS